jgi:hypothetical protein
MVMKFSTLLEDINIILQKNYHDIIFIINILHWPSNARENNGNRILIFNFINLTCTRICL